MEDTRIRPDQRLRSILIFNGPDAAGEENIFRTKSFFEGHGFGIKLLQQTDNVKDLQKAVCEEVRKYKDVFWVCCVVAPGANNVFLLNGKETADWRNTEKVSFDLVEKWFTDSRDSPESRVVMIFDMNASIPHFTSDGHGKAVTTDGNILRFVSYSKWADGKSPCMEQLCRDGTPSSMKEWLQTTKELMISANKTSNNLTQVPVISGRCEDPFDISALK
ncbi:hypothetical protein CAPTEDRAFT_223377 [Capitella teleta]|uniref:Caspase family p20 domain-containing protein n=1 Tax=Capitella teleta TaxID=283909 RepID=R7VGD0_CAPTE|nr:hypothetical protein CAPTEDRAFT_223377 [Capitella teleta]|eukprot:ELU15366.1 hypothetical protein CAPTEDRAFT_223377 [Capitella teleta]